MNQVQEGRTVTVTAPANVTAGQGVIVGALFGVARYSASTGAPVEIAREGVFTIAKTSALAISIGDRLFWDDTNKVVNKTSAGQFCVGVALSAATNPSSTVQICLGAVTPSGS
jgi:predicted RecA/RadA family phage recombinase